MSRSAVGVTPSMAGKTVLITGGTGGIDRAAAIRLASMGARVGITGRDRARAERAASAITGESGNPAVQLIEEVRVVSAADVAGHLSHAARGSPTGWDGGRHRE